MLFFRAVSLFGVAAAVAAAAPVAAAPMTFDCDTPANRSSSVSVGVGATVRIAGTLRTMSFQPAKNQPLGGMALSSADGLNAVGFQLLLPKPAAKALDLVIVARNNGKTERKLLQTVPFGTDLAFAMFVPLTGPGQIKLGDKVIPLSFANLKSGSVSAFCSSGQFQFVGLDVVSP